MSPGRRGPVGPGARRPASDRKADTPSWKGVALLHRRFLRTVAAGSAVAASLAAVAVVAPAGAAQSTPSAYVRIEGAHGTLLGQTLVRTHTGTKVEGHACSETSAAGALD